MNAKRWNDQNHRNQESHPDLSAIGLPYIIEVSKWGCRNVLEYRTTKEPCKKNAQWHESKTHLMTHCISGTYSIDYFSKSENVLLEIKVYFRFNTTSDINFVNEVFIPVDLMHTHVCLVQVSIRSKELYFLKSNWTGDIVILKTLSWFTDNIFYVMWYLKSNNNILNNQLVLYANLNSRCPVDHRVNMLGASDRHQR